jgi:phosphoenolpyruvate carboxykinase (GTP)
VLKWVFERVSGKGKAKETPIGYMPTEDAIDTTGLNISAADMQELLNVNKDEWKDELASIREHYAKFGDRFPVELKKELEGLEKRLG